MIRDNSIGNPFIDSVRNISGARKGVSGFSNITTGRVRNVPSAEYHGHLTGTYMVELNDSGTDQLIPCKVLKASASMDGVGEYIPLEEGDPVTVLFKDGRMDVGYILGGTHTEGAYREFLIEGKGKDPFSLTNTGSRDVEINQPSIHPDRVATPDAYFSIVGSRELGKDPYADVALSDPSNLQEVASQRPQPGSILIRNKQGDVAQYAKGDIILYADGDIILLSNKTKEAECNKLRNRVQYYKDLIKKLEAKFKGGSSNSSNNTSSNTSNESTNKDNSNNNNSSNSTELTDPFTIDSNTQKLSTTKIDGLVDLLTSKNITKFPNDDKAQYSISNKNKGVSKDTNNSSNSNPKPTLTDDPIKNIEKLKEYALSELSNTQYGAGSQHATESLTEALKELDKIKQDSPNYSKVPQLRNELETLSKQVSLSIGSETNKLEEEPSSSSIPSNSLPPDHPINREKYSVDTLLNADYLEPYIIRYHIDQLNKLVGITTSEIETCMRDLATIQSGNTSNTSNNSGTNSNAPNESTANYNPAKNKCGKTLVETIKNLSSITGKSYGSGTCYEGVADAIDYAGLGKIGGDCQVNGPNSVAVNLVGYTSWAVDFAKFFNEDPSRLKKFNIRNLKAEGINDPNDSRVPPGAVIVVGQNQFVGRIEGDINIKVDGGEYLNPRSMTSWMSASDYWKSEPDKVHGIYIDATSYSVDDKKTDNTSQDCPKQEESYGHKKYGEASASDLVSVGNSQMLKASAAKSFSQMVSAAKTSGASLVPLSGFRSIEDQKYLFYEVAKDRKQTPEERAKVSAPPGYSEHHTGYTLDIGDADETGTNTNPSFENTKSFKWLQSNAGKYGWELSFQKGDPNVSYEPWHWRYVGDDDAKKVFCNVIKNNTPTNPQANS